MPRARSVGSHDTARFGVSLTSLDRLVVVTMVATVVVHAFCTPSPAVAEKVGRACHWIRAPFVVCGIFRYLFLVYTCDKTERYVESEP